MKEKSSIKTVNFICDECRHRSGHRPELDSSNFTGEHPFPYTAGWIYVFNFSFKGSSKIIIKDKHFCSKSCFCKYLNMLIANLYGKCQPLK